MSKSESVSPRWRRFGQWYAEQIRAAQLTQKEVAEKSGLHEVQVSRIVNGTSGTKRETIPALARAVGVDVNDAYEKAGYAPDRESSDELAVFASRLRMAMAEKGIGPTELAARLSESDVVVSVQSVAAWAAGDSAPRLGKVRAIADTLGVPIGYLLGDESTVTMGDPDTLREMFAVLRDQLETSLTDRITQAIAEGFPLVRLKNNQVGAGGHALALRR